MQIRPLYRVPVSMDFPRRSGPGKKAETLATVSCHCAPCQNIHMWLRLSSSICRVRRFPMLVSTAGQMKPTPRSREGSAFFGHWAVAVHHLAHRLVAKNHSWPGNTLAFPGLMCGRRPSGAAHARCSELECTLKHTSVQPAALGPIRVASWRSSSGCDRWQEWGRGPRVRE